MDATKVSINYRRKSLADQPPTLSVEHSAPHPTPVVEEYVTADEDEEKEASKVVLDMDMIASQPLGIFLSFLEATRALCRQVWELLL